MRIVVDAFTSVATDADGNVYVTCPDMRGRVVTHAIATKEYTPLDISIYLHNRQEGRYVPLIQDAFPKMSAEDREFLITGITPTEWNKIFGDNKEA